MAQYRALGRAVVAVRSSALHEDGKEASAAGLQETILGVADETALADAIRQCFASIYRERALECREKFELTDGGRRSAPG